MLNWAGRIGPLAMAATLTLAGCGNQSSSVATDTTSTIAPSTIVPDPTTTSTISEPTITPVGERPCPESPGEPGRLEIGFHEFPDLETGDHYACGTVTLVDDVLRFAEVKSEDVADTRARADADPNVEYVADSTEVHVPNDSPEGPPDTAPPGPSS